MPSPAGRRAYHDIRENEWQSRHRRGRDTGSHPESVDISTTNGFGLKLVSGLAGQLNGNVRIDRTNGTKVVLEFDV
jgi:two-component sensor histidine kinase